METGKAATVSVVRNALNENSLAVETSIQTNSKVVQEIHSHSNGLFQHLTKI